MGIDSTHSVKDSAAYIQSWIRALRNDISLLPVAAGKAEKAVEYILGQKE
jgi:antirestriction protein ArdC